MEVGSEMNTLLGEPVARMTERQVAVARELQDELLDEWQKVFNRWCERRHRTADAVVALTRDSLRAKDLENVMQAWAQWSRGTFERLAEDARDQMEVSASVVRCCGTRPLALMQGWGGAEARQEPAEQARRIEKAI